MNKINFYLNQIIENISNGYNYIIHRNKDKMVGNLIFQNNQVNKNKSFVKSKKRK